MLHVIERPVTCRDAKYDFISHVRVSYSALENADAVSVAEVVRVLWKVSLQLKVSDPHANDLHIVLMDVGVGERFAKDFTDCIVANRKRHHLCRSR